MTRPTDLLASLPTLPMPAGMEQRIDALVAPAIRALATGRTDPATRQIVITPCDADALDLAGRWGQEDGINGNANTGALHFAGQALESYNVGYTTGQQMRTRFWGG